MRSINGSANGLPGSAAAAATPGAMPDGRYGGDANAPPSLPPHHFPGPHPELKHHADFLSRLLAATPAYMSADGVNGPLMSGASSGAGGNPPPGFFSEWLRRLVSTKPNGSTFGNVPGLESSPVDVGEVKKRKRSRVTDHSPATNVMVSDTDFYWNFSGSFD